VALPQIEQHNVSAYAQYTLRVEARVQLQDALQRADIPSAIHYPLPLNRQPAVADAKVVLPHSERAAEEVISLPLHPYLTEEHQAEVIDALNVSLACRSLY
jgi:UDP-2-acetamido-2-deoxy-ribo-hexuluronate aminotransferase